LLLKTHLNIDHPIIVFDGICNLCNNAVNFIIRRDLKNIFFYSTSQSEFSRNYLINNNHENISESTVMLINEGKLLTHSDAILQILEILEFNPIMLRLLKIFPSRLLDLFYKIISSNRYRIFGRRKHCIVPDSIISQRFIV